MIKRYKLNSLKEQAKDLSEQLHCPSEVMTALAALALVDCASELEDIKDMVSDLKDKYERR